MSELFFYFYDFIQVSLFHPGGTCSAIHHFLLTSCCNSRHIIRIILFYVFPRVSNSPKFLPYRSAITRWKESPRIFVMKNALASTGDGKFKTHTRWNTLEIINERNKIDARVCDQQRIINDTVEEIQKSCFCVLTETLNISFHSDERRRNNIITRSICFIFPVAPTCN